MLFSLVCRQTGSAHRHQLSIELAFNLPVSAEKKEGGVSEAGNERNTTSFSKQEAGEATSVSCGVDEVSKDVIGSFHFVKVSEQIVLEKLSCTHFIYTNIYIYMMFIILSGSAVYFRIH